MERTKSLLLRNAVFGVACVAFAAVIALRSDGTTVSDDARGLGPAFPPVAVDKVKSFELAQGTKVDGKDVKEGVKLVRVGDGWRLASSYDYPADTGKVEGYLKGLSRAKRHAEPTSNPAKFADFAGTEGFLEVRVYEAEATPTLSFGVGKASASDFARKFVRLDAAATIGASDAGTAGEAAKAGRILEVSEVETYGSPTSPTYWIETRLLPTLTSAEISELTVEQGGETPRTFALARGKKADPKDPDGDEPWVLTVDRLPEPALREPVLGLVRGFVGLTLASIEAGGAKVADAATYGFDKPELVIGGVGKAPADGAPAPTWTITVGKKLEGKSAFYARRATGGAVDPFVFSVNDYDLTDFRKEPSSFAEKKPAPPAPESPAMAPDAPPAPEGPAMGEAPGAPPTSPPTIPPATPPEGPPAAPDAPPAMGEAPPAPGPTPAPTPAAPQPSKDASPK